MVDFIIQVVLRLEVCFDEFPVLTGERVTDFDTDFTRFGFVKISF